MSDKNNEQQIKNLENINDLNDRRITAEKQLLNILRKNSKELETSDKKHTKAMEAIVKSQRSFNQTLKETKDLLRDTIGIFVSWNFAGELLNAAKGVVAMEKSLYRASINAGKTADEGKKVVGIAAQMRMNFGATAEDAEKVLKTFVKGQYKGNIEKAASASYQFARAMGISQETVSKNTLELQKWGKIGPEAATAMYTDIMKVAQGYGMTSEGAEEVIKTTTKLSGYMRAFGKSETQIQKMNLGFAKMVSSMEKVGVSAQDALSMVERLLDPEKIEENIPAYAALGVSITDAINGNINPDQITAGMKEVGNKLKEMGPIAGAAYAKAMGISYKNAIKSADLEEITEEAMTPQDTAAEQMKQLTENTKNMTEKINDLMNKFQGLIQGLGPVAMVVFGGLLPKIVKKIVSNLFKSVKDSLKNGMTEGATEGGTRVQKILSEIQNKKIKINAEVDLDQTKKEIRQKGKDDKKLKKLVLTKTGRNAAEALRDEKRIEAKKLLDEKIIAERQFNALLKARAYIQDTINSLGTKGKQITEEEAKRLTKAYNELSKTDKVYKEQKANLDVITEKYKEQHTELKDINKILEDTAGIDLKPSFREAFEKARKDTLENFEDKKLSKQEAKANKDPNGLTKALVNWKNEGKGVGKFIGKHFVNEANKVDIAKPLKDAGKKLGEFGKEFGRGAAEVISKVKIGIAKGAGIVAGSKIGRATGAVAKGAGKAVSGVGGLIKALGKFGPLVGGVMLLVALLMKLEPVQKAIEIVMNKVGGILNKVGKILQPILEEITGVILDVLDGLMPLIEILAHLIVPILKVMLVPLKILSFLIQKLTHTQAKNNVSLDANTEQMKKEESKPAQIKRNEDGTLSSTMATAKSEEIDSGASKQNTATETRIATVADSELKQKLDVISSHLFNLSATMERYLNFNISMEQKRGSNEDNNLKKQSQVMKESIKDGIASIGVLPVDVMNFPRAKGGIFIK